MFKSIHLLNPNHTALRRVKLQKPPSVNAYTQFLCQQVIHKEQMELQKLRIIKAETLIDSNQVKQGGKYSVSSPVKLAIF